MLALLDGDILACRVGYSCETKDETTKEKSALPAPIAYARLTDMVENCLAEIGTRDYKIFLTDSKGNFRKGVVDSYKANRKPEDKPILLPQLEEYLINKFGAIRAVGEEADDLLGIYQTMYWEAGVERTVIASIDKDLLQIPGSHYNFVRMEWHEVTEEDGLYWFYRQLVMGDSTDSVSGCPGIGEKKADKLLMPYKGDEQAMYQAVFETYAKHYQEKIEEQYRLDDEMLTDLITTVGRLVYIRKHPGELWLPPNP